MMQEASPQIIQKYELFQYLADNFPESGNGQICPNVVLIEESFAQQLRLIAMVLVDLGAARDRLQNSWYDRQLRQPDYVVTSEHRISARAGGQRKGIVAYNFPTYP